MLAARLPANTLQGMMQLCCDQLLDDGDASVFYSQRVFDLFPQMATANSGLATHFGDGTAVFGSEIGSAAATDGHYIEWSVYVPSGTFKVTVVYYRTSNGAYVDFNVDGGAVIETLDTYNAGGSANNKWTNTTAFSLSEGLHTIRLTKNGKNPSAGSGAVYLQHCQLVKQNTGSALTSVANVPHVIDVPVVFADSHTNWNTLTMSTNLMFGTYVVSTGAQNAAVTFSFWAPKGNFTLAALHSTGPSQGIASVTVDGGSVGTIDQYGSSLNNVLNTSVTGTLTSTGIHTITFTMATKHASSASYIGTLNHIQIRMTSITEPLSADLAPEVALFWPVFNEGNTTWSTATVSGSQAYYYYYVSGGAQNSEITLSTNTVLRPGTYRLDLLVVTLSSIGKYHVLVDTVDLGNYDGYSVGTVNNVVGTIGSLALTGYTPHTIKLKMSDKNASSSNYVGRLTLARLIRTGS